MSQFYSVTVPTMRWPVLPSSRSQRVWAEPAPQSSGFFVSKVASWSCSPVVTPTVVWLSDHIELGWRLRKPILLTIQTDDDGECVATDAFSTVYGHGATEQIAVNDYCISLVDYYLVLEDQSAGNLQNALRLQALRQYIVNITNSDATQAKRH